MTTAASGPDELLLRTFLHGRNRHTARAYERDVRGFLAAVDKPIAEVTLADLQAWSGGLDSLAQSSRNRARASVKSLFAFAKEMGAIATNPAAALRIERATATPAERILAEPDTLRMLTVENDPRRHVLLQLLYRCGLRRSEVPPLRWRDLVGSEKRGGVVRVLGKGSKIREVEVSPALWRMLAALTPNARAEDPLIPGRDGRQISVDAIYRAVGRAGRRAGVGRKVSPHWMRHAHCSHAIANGADIAKVRDSAGHASIATTSKYIHAAPGSGAGSYLKG